MNIQTLLGVISVSAIGVWLGSMLFFSAVVAPRLFRTLPKEEAGEVVGEIFPTYFASGTALGLIGLVGSLAGDFLTGSPGTTGLVAAAALGVGILSNGYARWVLIPKMRAASKEGFSRYHGRSVALNGLAILGAFVGLVAVQL